jgi:rfaE bifunctional protein nucleotidyltransferase chain/domain
MTFTQGKRIKIPEAVAVVQFNVQPGDCQANLSTVQNAVARLHPPAGTLVVLPELWGSGFAYDDLPGMSAKSHELLDNLQQLARDYRIALAGSLLEEDAGKYYNTLFISDKEGIQGRYRKQHLFEPMAEDSHLKPGNSPYPINTPYGTLAGLICYDLRFPELAAAQVGRGAGCLLVTAQWPEIRLEHWRILLKARAIENQVFVVACNRCGTGDDTKFAGHSMVIAPDGSVLREANDEAAAFVVNLDAQMLANIRANFNTAAPSPYSFAARDKIMSQDDLRQNIQTAKEVGKKVVFTNGCFDILHQGHTTYLEGARRQGDCLVVGLNSDASIRAIKGPERPVNSEDSRARVLAALGCVDYVTIFGEETPLNLIKSLMPDILVKGADWPVDKIVGAREVMANGGQVINIPTVEGYSTTNVIGAIKGQL